MLWSKSLSVMSFDAITAANLVGWLQSIATLLILIMVWMSFVGLIMRFVWTPALLDTALPFLIGLLQFAIIEVTTPARLGIWLIGLGLLMLAITAISQRYYKRARLDPRNDEFFGDLAPATWQDMLPEFTASTLCFLAGAAVLNLQLGDVAACLILAVLILGLGYFLYVSNKFWVRSVTSATPTPKDDTPTE